MQSDVLIVEDLLLLLLDDEAGVPAGAGTLYTWSQVPLLASRSLIANGCFSGSPGLSSRAVEGTAAWA